MSDESLPEPMAQGDLRQTPFAHLLLYVLQKRLDGTLVLWRPAAGDGPAPQDRIRFLAGVPVAGRLVERASQLDRGLLPLFARTEGPYAFYETVDLVGSSDRVRSGRIDVLPLIAASLRGSSRDDVVDQVVGGLGGGKLRLRRGVDLSGLGLLPDEQTCIELLRASPASAAELAELTPVGARMAQRLVYLLALAKAIEPWEEPALPLPSMPAPPTSSKAPDAKSPERNASAAAPEQGDDARASGPARSGRPSDASMRSVPVVNRGPEPAPPPPAGLSPEHAVLWADISARALAIEEENYFEMLGLLREAPAVAIQKAYFAAVKKWHPDRLPAELGALRPHVEEVFRHLTRAHEILSDETKRGQYLATVQDGGGTPATDRKLGQIIQAAMEFRKVEVLSRRREWDAALAVLDGVIALNDEESDYHAARGWIVFSRNTKDDDRASIIKSLERALELNPRHDKAHYYYGLFHKREKRSADAVEHFRRAAELNSRNLEALREVRLAEMRSTGEHGPSESGDAKKKTGAAGESIFGRIFGGVKKS